MDDRTWGRICDEEAEKSDKIIDTICVGKEILNTLIISPVAGVKMEKINTALGGNKKIIRVMPNTPLMYSAGATAIAVGGDVSDEEKAFCEKIFASSGVTAFLPEEQIDTVSGISGSSPAFFMRFAREL